MGFAAGKGAGTMGVGTGVGVAGAEGRHDAPTIATELISRVILEAFIIQKVVAREGPNESPSYAWVVPSL